MLSVNDLKVGDLIFTVSNKDNRYSGHVAICYKTNAKPKHLRIIHATDCPTYFSLCSTKLNPSTRLLAINSQYQVIRCRDKALLHKALTIFENWLPYQIPFDNAKLKTMEQFDNAHERTINARLTELNSRFKQASYKKELTLMHSRRHTVPFFPGSKEGFFCSSAILLPFQIAALSDYPDLSLIDYKTVIPDSLRIDCNLASPTALLNSLLNPDGLFECIGELRSDYSRDQIEEEMLKDERLLSVQQSEHHVQSFLAQSNQMPESLKCQITGAAHPEANMVRHAYREMFFIYSRRVIRKFALRHSTMLRL